MTQAGPEPAARKAELRGAVQAWRRAQSLAAVGEWSLALCAGLQDWGPLQAARVVLAFRPLRREPQIEPLLQGLRARGAQVALLGAGAANAEPLPAGIEAVLVPGLAFDRLGRRLGRGGGHYDRLLPRLPAACLRIGVCFQGQLRDTVPAEAWDQGVDAVATEAGVWEVATRARA